MKLIISKKCTEKIHIWNMHDNGKEISGTAVYEVRESFPNGFPKIVELTNFIILDMGMGASTAFSGKKMAQALFNMREDINDNSFIGIIHSHVEMNVFFSGTDGKQLSDSTPEIGFLISTIFNHKKEFAAKISYKDQYGIIQNIVIDKIEYTKPRIPDYLLEEIDSVTKESKNKEVSNNRFNKYNHDYYLKYSQKQIIEKNEEIRQLDCFSKKDYTPEVYEAVEDNQLVQYYMNQIIETYQDLDEMEEYFNTKEMEKYKKLCPEYQNNILALYVLFQEGTISSNKLKEMNKIYGY